ncbi:MAG: ABC transporter substrate-binding protein [Flavobacteriales bacterium]|nr:ABC transporter substrate-binding protein [Flavobacteriales bacterium]
MRIIYLFIFSFLISCQSISEENKSKNNLVKPPSSKSHFSIQKKGNSYLIEVKKPFVGADFTERYLLYPKDSLLYKKDNIIHYIPYPVNSLAVTSTTHVGFLNAIDGLKYIKAANNLDWVYNPKFKQLHEEGKIASIGNRDLNHESIIQQEVDVVLSYAIDMSSYNEIKRLRALGQQVVLISEFMEQNPLDKAAWLEVFALLIGKQQAAEEYLLDLKKNYISLKESAQNKPGNTTLLMGFPWKGTWYMSGGMSFQATLFKDANCRYLWANTPKESGMPLNIEEVIHKALDADVWVNTNAMNSLDEIKEIDARFTAFSAFKNKAIYNFNKRINANGGNDYWESGVVHPDWILQDLIKIIHPDLLQDRDFIYYQKLN